MNEAWSPEGHRVQSAVSFESLGLGPPLLSALRQLGHVQPTAVQLKAIGAVLEGRDVWATASTGSGKTGAFVLPLLERLLRAGVGYRQTQRLGALVLSPTRELAAQLAHAVEAYGAHLPVRPKCVVAFGGVSINPQMMALRGGADVVVATPGRLLDLLDHNALSLRGLGTLVLDEADRLLDGDFQNELRRIQSRIDVRPQTLLFSATFAPAIEAIARAALHEPVKIDVRAAADEVPDIQHRAIAVDVPRRTQLLAHLIGASTWRQVLVFVASSYATEHVAQKLRGLRIHAGALSGQLSQGARTDVLDRFRSGRLRVLVATDLAARGLDIGGLPAVIQYDLPRSTEDYVHRSGRTGRAGAPGVCISFVTADAQGHFALIQKRHGIDAALEQLPGFLPTESPSPAPTDAGTGGIKGRRKSKKDRLREAAARSKP